MITLRNYITRRYNNNHSWEEMPNEMQLTEEDCQEIGSLLNCRRKSKEAIVSLLLNSPTTIEAHGIYDRVYKDSERGWDYCCGQCWTTEIALIRKLLKKEAK